MASPRKPAHSNTICIEEKLNCFPATSENKGNNILVKASAKANAISDMRIDSPMNCQIRDFFSAPKTFRTPTSADLFEDRAVDRFMKLMHAINNVKRAIDPSMYK